MIRSIGEDEDALIVEEMQTILQEKRTALKVIRIGIALVMGQAAAAGIVAGVFVRRATFLERGAMDALAALGVFLLGLALYLIGKALIRIRRLDREILNLKRRRGERGRPGV